MSITTIDKLRAQWSRYITPNPKQQKQVWKKRKHTSREQQKRDFHYTCPYCNEPIFHNQYGLTTFRIDTSQYIHVSSTQMLSERGRKERGFNERDVCDSVVIPTMNKTIHYTTLGKTEQATQIVPFSCVAASFEVWSF